MVGIGLLVFSLGALAHNYLNPNTVVTPLDQDIHRGILKMKSDFELIQTGAFASISNIYTTCNATCLGDSLVSYLPTNSNILNDFANELATSLSPADWNCVELAWEFAKSGESKFTACFGEN